MNYLIGEKIDYSLSPEIHKCFGNDSYAIKEVGKESISSFFKERKFEGINITIPYKIEAIKYVDWKSELASQVGCVNTVINQNGMLKGYNSDVYGLIALFKRFSIDIKDKHVIVLGSGGASRTACYVCNKLYAKKVSIVSRKGTINYSNIYELDGNVIINATPFGTKQTNDDLLVDLSKFKNLESVIDLVYNPLNTSLLQQAKHLGIKHVNGLFMLVEQARISEKLFKGEIDTDEDNNYLDSIDIYNLIKTSNENIVLVGMPGAGKTTIGKELSKLTGKEFVDIDDEIEIKEGMIIPEIFSTKGEEEFRKIESEVIKDVCQRKNIIIASGGGAILDKSNRFYMQLNGIIVWIRRDISKLETKGRPLSKNEETLKFILKSRYDIYKNIADIGIDIGEREVLDCANEIIRGI